MPKCICQYPVNQLADSSILLGMLSKDDIHVKEKSTKTLDACIEAYIETMTVWLIFLQNPLLKLMVYNEL